MSWSVSTGVVRREEVEAAVDALKYPIENSPENRLEGDSGARLQFQAAKNAAKLVLAAFTGPFVVVTLNGHSNGWNGKPGNSVYVAVANSEVAKSA